MRIILFSLAISIVLAGSAHADPIDRLRVPPAKAEVQKPRAQGPASNPCAEYGPGFGKIAGTDTCVKIGGSIGIGVGGSSGMTMPR